MSRTVSQFERPAAPPGTGWATLSQVEPVPANNPKAQSAPTTTSIAVANAGRGILDDSRAVSRWRGIPASSSPGTDKPLVGAATGSRAVTRFVVAFLLAIHAGLLGWQACRDSPTRDEPAHLTAGISHSKFGRCDPSGSSEKICNAATEGDGGQKCQ
jgi:hypothetical protein